MHARALGASDPDSCGSRRLVFADLRTQFNVIVALTVRDLQGLGKAYNYGFAWALLEPLMFIAIMRGLRSVLKGLTPPDMPPTTFLMIGIIPFYLYVDAVGSVYKSVAGSNNLVQFPRVTPIDIAIAAALTDFCLYSAIIVILLVPVSIYEHVFPPQNVLKVLLALMLLWSLGVAVGFVAGAAARVLPPIKQFISYYNLVNRMAGGMLFVITMFPSMYWPYLTWNPVLHCMEMLRDAWFVTYTSPVADPAYVLEILVGLLLLGLSLERYQRRLPHV
jgi:capsular polysaccharide transport system permease protein